MARVGMGLIKNEHGVYVVRRKVPPRLEEAVATPRLTFVNGTGNTLMEALTGWKMERDRSEAALRQYERACTLFIQLHGNLPIGRITRDHARRFREALQGLPSKPTRKHGKMTVLELIEWRREHLGEPRMVNASVNKYIGGMQAVLNWARDKGMITDGVWANP